MRLFGIYNPLQHRLKTLLQTPQTRADGDRVKLAAVADRDPARADAVRRRFPVPLTREYMHSVTILDSRVVDISDAENGPPELASGSRNFLATGNRAINRRRGRPPQ